MRIAPAGFERALGLICLKAVSTIPENVAPGATRRSCPLAANLCGDGMSHRARRHRADPCRSTQAIAVKGAEDTDAVSTQAEAALYSEAVVIEAQARHAQPLQGGENLLASAPDRSSKSL